MTVHRYAFLVETDINKYEVFHIARISDDNPQDLERVNRMDNIIASGDTISGQAANEKPGLLIGSTWDGLNFTLPSPIPEYVIGTESESGVLYTSIDGSETLSGYTLLHNNTVFYMLAPSKGSFMDQKFAAAFAGNLSLKKINEGALVTVGYIWDGITFSFPE